MKQNIGQIKGRWSRKLGKRRRRKWKRERAKRKRKKRKRGAETCSLKKQQILMDLIDVEDGGVAVVLPSLGAQHIFILIELCFHCRGSFVLEI